MTITVDKRKALRLMAKAVEAKGIHYEVGIGGCQYAKTSDTTKPSCIVGHVIHAVVDEDTFEYTFGQGVYLNGEIFSKCYEQIQSKAEVHFTAGAVKVLSMAQDVQDHRTGSDPTWGNALDRARKV